MATLFFPTLLGLGFNFVRRPKGSTTVQEHTTGRESRLGHWAVPLYEWELTFDVLQDSVRNPGLYPSFITLVSNPEAIINSELRRLQGFYLRTQGPLIPFYFLDPTDASVVGQFIATADGSATSFPVIHTNGDGVTGPVGLVNQGVPLNAYLNGIPQTDFTITGDGAGSAFVTFASPPPAGVEITMDLGFFHYVHFKDDEVEFSKFADKFWMAKKLVLESLRPEPIT